MSVIDDEIKSAYEKDGIVFIRNFFEQDYMSAVRAQLEDYIRNVLPKVPDAHYVYEDGGGVLRNLWRMDLYDPFFEDFGRHSKLRELVTALEGWAYELHYVEAFLKPERCGSEIPMHQDFALQHLSEPQFLTAWFPLDPVSESNGALRFIPGSHHWGNISHTAVTNAGSRLVVESAEALKQLPYVAAELVPGDVAVFGCQTVHYSPPNTSENPRRALAVGMRGPKAHVQSEQLDWQRVVDSMDLKEPTR